MLEKWLILDGPNATWNKLEHAITNVQRAEVGLDPNQVKLNSNISPSYSMMRYYFTVKIFPLWDFMCCKYGIINHSYM